MDELQATAADVADHLRQIETRVVFAESCTAGLIAATLAEIPGISHYLCGSAVVYRNDTKHCWLQVAENTLEHAGAVSEPVAAAMVEGVLRITPEAEVAVAVTGHLGPDAPEDKDGLVFVAIGCRDEPVSVTDHRLGSVGNSSEIPLRIRRQRRAATIVLETLGSLLLQRGGRR